MKAPIIHALVMVTMMFAVSAGIVAQDKKSPSSETLLKAQVAQLTAQLAAASNEIAVLRAQLAMATQAQTQKQLSDQRAAIEKEAGCPLDWNANPPACKAP